MFARKGILFDWVGVLVVPSREPSSDAPEDVAASFARFEPLWRALPDLADRFRLCVVNNGPASTVPYFEARFGYSKYMDFVNSEAVGFEKPDPKIYLLACERLGLAPGEVLYMDDEDGFPAETLELGMEFIHWETPETGFERFSKWLAKNARTHT